MKISKIHDISMQVTPDTIVYPNNPIPEVSVIRKVPQASSTLSQIVLGSHTATHADSLAHVKENAPTTETLPLPSLVGECRVLDLTHARQVSKEELKKHAPKQGEILLLKTDNANHAYEKFREDFAHVTLNGAQYLAEKKVKTLGVDYLSVQKFHSGNQLVHLTLLQAGITVFEGLDLRKIRPGTYFFAGLPLKIAADGAPARAVLIEFE